MPTSSKRIRNHEDGAVTIDWVVLTAAIVGLGIAVLTSINGGTNAQGADNTLNLPAQTTATN